MIVLIVVIIILILSLLAKHRSLTTVKRELQRAYMCPTYGILTRAGVDFYARNARSFDLVFFDIDNMHEANARWGYTEVDARIRRAVSVRSADTLLAGRWYSGDEIVVLVSPGSGAGAADRLRQAFVQEGMSATFAVVSGTVVDEAALAASAKVQTAKAEGRRGTVN